MSYMISNLMKDYCAVLGLDVPSCVSRPSRSAGGAGRAGPGVLVPPDGSPRRAEEGDPAVESSAPTGSRGQSGRPGPDRRPPATPLLRPSGRLERPRCTRSTGPGSTRRRSAWCWPRAASRSTSSPGWRRPGGPCAARSPGGAPTGAQGSPSRRGPPQGRRRPAPPGGAWGMIGAARTKKCPPAKHSRRRGMEAGVGDGPRLPQPRRAPGALSVAPRPGRPHGGRRGRRRGPRPGDLAGGRAAAAAEEAGLWREGVAGGGARERRASAPPGVRAPRGQGARGGPLERGALGRGAGAAARAGASPARVRGAAARSLQDGRAPALRRGSLVRGDRAAPRRAGRHRAHAAAASARRAPRPHGRGFGRSSGVGCAPGPGLEPPRCPWRARPRVAPPRRWRRSECRD